MASVGEATSRALSTPLPGSLDAVPVQLVTRARADLTRNVRDDSGGRDPNSERGVEQSGHRWGQNSPQIGLSRLSRCLTVLDVVVSVGPATSLVQGTMFTSTSPSESINTGISSPSCGNSN